MSPAETRGAWPESGRFSWTYVGGSHVDATYRETQRPESAHREACGWAQKHAERCRALPREEVRA